MKKHNFGNSFPCWLFIHTKKDKLTFVKAFKTILSAMRYADRHYPKCDFVIHSQYIGIPDVKNFNGNYRKLYKEWGV